MADEFHRGQSQGDDFRINEEGFQGTAGQSPQSGEAFHVETGSGEGELQFDDRKLADMMMRLEGEQSIVLGLIGGVGGAIVGAIAWALITAITGFQIGFMAIGVGFLVGYAVRVFGKGMSNTFGIIGAIFALLGCLMGNVLSGSLMLAFEEGVPLFSAVLIAFNPLFAIEMLRVMFSPIDLLFYGFAIYEGYHFSFRQISAEELTNVSKLS